MKRASAWLLVGLGTLAAQPPPADPPNTPSAARMDRPTKQKDEPFVFETWSKQKLAAFRGSFAVPENRTAHDGRSISIKYVRLPATTRAPGPPIVYLAGGPGGSGIEAINYRYRLMMAMREYGDVIALDQRGTGASNVVPVCRSGEVIPTDRAVPDRLFIEHFRNALKECLAFWRAHGTDLTGYNTVQNALDLEALRKHLGADKLVILGTSYGSTLALEALRQMPGRIAKVVLSSVRGLNQTMKLPARADEYVARLQQAVDSQPEAKAVYPDIGALMRRVHAKLARAPVFVKLKSVHGTTIRYLLQEHDMELLAGALIEDPATAAHLLPIYRALDRGIDPGLDHIPVRFLPDYLASPGEPIALEGMSVAVNISSGMTARRRGAILKQARSSILGRYLDHMLLAFDGVAPELDIGDGLRANPKSSAPVLVFMGTLDGRTDIADQREAVSGLKALTPVTVRNAGHNLLDNPSPEMFDIIRRFMGGLPIDERTISVPLPDFAPAPIQGSTMPVEPRNASGLRAASVRDPVLATERQSSDYQ
ncbi:MAG: alpha/beta fold hydrolase [Steroidobacteraceae bacterium]